MKAHIVVPYTDVVIDKNTNYSPPIIRKKLKEEGYDDFRDERKASGVIEIEDFGTSDHWVMLKIGDKEIAVLKRDLIKIAHFFGK